MHLKASVSLSIPHPLSFSLCTNVASFRQSPLILVRTISCWTALGMSAILISIQTTYALLPCCLTTFLCVLWLLCGLSTVKWATWEAVWCTGRHTYAPGPRRYVEEGGETSPPPLDDAACARVAGPHLCTPPVHPAGTDVPSAAVGSCCLPESESSPSRG